MRDWQQQILLVSPFFFPELISTGKANRHLAEAFAAEGHGVTVVCSHPLYPAWHPSETHARIDGLKILRGGTWVRYPKSMALRRLILEVWFACYAARRARRLRKHVDVVVGVLPPSAFAYLLNLLLPKRVRRVAVIHDLQGLLAAREKGFSRKAIVRLVHAVESRVFRAQDLCIFFSADMAREARQAYRLDPKKVAVQYPCITLDDPRASRETMIAPRHLLSFMPPERPQVVYSGALGFKQNSRQFVEFLLAAAERFPQADFHVLSGGPIYDELRDRGERLTGPRVQFHPLVPERDLGELYARSSIQVIPQAEGTEAAALPSKLPNLMAAGVYLLGICAENSEVGRLIQRAGTGAIVERWDLDLFLARVQKALETVAVEPASVRRERVEPLLPLFSGSNLVRLAMGDDSGPPAAHPVQPQPEQELAMHRSGAR